MPNVSSFGAQTDNAVVQGTVTDRQIVIPDVPPQGLQSVGPRVTPHFVKEPWNDRTSYNFFDTVKDGTGASYIAIKPVVPAGTELANERFWFMWSDPDAQFAELQEIVKTYNKRINDNASAISAEVTRATSAESTKAPMNHASEETVYGIGNELNFGHVRLATDDTPMTSDANAGIAATPKMIQDSIKNSHPNDVIVLGDSFSDAAYLGFNAWPTFFEQFTGMKTHNFAKANAGFNRSGTDGKNFQQQLIAANNDHSIIKRNVKYVILYGGYNDVINKVTPSQCQTEAEQIASNVATNYPNAKLIVCLCTFGHRDALEDSFVSFSKQVGAFFNQCNATVISNAYAWLIGQPNDYTRDDLLHPSEKGEKFIARLMTEAIYGSWNASAFFEFDFTNAYFTTDVNTKLNLKHSGPACLKIENGIVNISIYAFDWPTIKSAKSGQLKIPVKKGNSNFNWNKNVGFGVSCKNDILLHGSYPSITGRSELRNGFFNNGEITLPFITEGENINTTFTGDFVQAVKVL